MKMPATFLSPSWSWVESQYSECPIWFSGLWTDVGVRTWGLTQKSWINTVRGAYCRNRTTVTNWTHPCSWACLCVSALMWSTNYCSVNRQRSQTKHRELEKANSINPLGREHQPAQKLEPFSNHILSDTPVPFPKASHYKNFMCLRPEIFFLICTQILGNEYKFLYLKFFLFFLLFNMASITLHIVLCTLVWGTKLIDI
jgi:hypothetical protein